MRTVRFTLADAETAADGWFNCGPAALCAVADLMPHQAVSHLRGFKDKHYTNPSMMQGALASLRLPFRRVYECLGRGQARTPIYPAFGLVRVQWGGPWCAAGVPVAARYRHTHWVAWDAVDGYVFDINAISEGGWLPEPEWRGSLVPWLLREVEPTGNGGWWPTHCWNIEPRSAA